MSLATRFGARRKRNAVACPKSRNPLPEAVCHSQEWITFQRPHKGFFWWIYVWGTITLPKPSKENQARLHRSLFPLQILLFWTLEVFRMDIEQYYFCHLSVVEQRVCRLPPDFRARTECSHTPELASPSGAGRAPTTPEFG
jgi:hypothetical protein